MKDVQGRAVIFLVLMFTAPNAQSQSKADLTPQSVGKGVPQAVPGIQVIYICDPAPIIDTTQSQVTSIFEGNMMQAGLGGRGGAADRCGVYSEDHTPKSRARERSAHNELLIIRGKGQ